MRAAPGRVFLKACPSYHVAAKLTKLQLHRRRSKRPQVQEDPCLSIGVRIQLGRLELAEKTFKSVLTQGPKKLNPTLHKLGLLPRFATDCAAFAMESVDSS
jgi:hypothetical protein